MSKLFVKGKWRKASNSETIPVRSPVDGMVFDAIARGSATDADLAMQAAQRAFDGPWGRSSATERGRVLVKLAQKILDNSEDLARLEAWDTGNPLTTPRNDIHTDGSGAIALANGTELGLVAAAWTENGARKQRVAKAVRCGQVFIDCYGAGGGVE